VAFWDPPSGSKNVGFLDQYLKVADVPQVMKLRQAKNELERKVQDQEEELDEQAGTIQQLEQVRILLFCVDSGLFFVLVY